MVSPILTTKLYIPPTRSDRLARPRLIRQMEAGFQYPLVIVSASAGSGKTTLLSEWVTASDHPIAWLSLDPPDNDPVQFITYLIHALRTLQDDFGEAALDALGAGQAVPLEEVLIHLINEAAQFPEPFALVLDDYHVIADARISELLAFLIEHLPPQMHLVIASRMDPSLPVARYRARSQVFEIRGQDLRFSLEEVAQFLQSIMGLEISTEDIAALEKRTEGWVAGLQLAALSLQGQSDIPAFIKAFTGSHRYVAEYLVEEILNQQPEKYQNFLLQTSILDRLNAGLCNAVTGGQDGQTMLNGLHRANIFLIPLDSQGEWFRYHHLFADLLQARLKQALSPGERTALHTRAAAWHQQHGELPSAVEHTFAAGDLKSAATLVDLAGQSMIILERNNLLKRWLDALPEEAFQAQPRLAIYRLMINQSNAALDMYEDTLLEQEALIKSLPPSPENDLLRRRALLHLALSLAFQNTAKAIRIAEDTLAEMQPEDSVMGAYLYSAFYRGYGMDGDIERSAPAYRECLRFSEISGQYALVANTTMIRTFDLCQYGRLDEAADYCQRIIDAGNRLKRAHFYPAGSCYIGLAGIHLERDELEKAEEYHTRGMELCRQGAPYGLFTGNEQLVRLLQAQGKLDAAVQAMHHLEQNFQRREFTLMTRKVALLLAVDDQNGLAELVPTLKGILAPGSYARQLPLIAAEAFKLSLARIYLAQGKVAEANNLLDEIQQTVAPGKRFGRLMETHVLRALGTLQDNQGIVTLPAIEEMLQALELAEGPGFVRLLVEDGQALIPLLEAILSRTGVPIQVRQHARKVLQAFGEPGTTEAGADALVEPLTPREMEVLALIADGDSNQEIAEKLVITVRTVKKHTSNILGKLNASSRTQAAAYARQLELLPSEE